jgi:tRNA threonylcarbamoyladenosine modification (KEOPS) complex  Pcc1 subunit
MAESAAGEPRPAFYALRGGGWRDYWSLLHPPYTVWHLSYVVIGACVAERLRVGWLVETLVAFFLAMGVAAHSLDELNGRPLGTRIPRAVLIGLALVGLAGAVTLGVHGASEVSPWIWAFIVAGVVLVPAYNLEWFGGAVHSDLWFALAWGGFPALTASFAQSARVTPAAIVVAGGCAATSAAQRVLSTPVRRLRRDVSRVEGVITLHDGTTEAVDAASLRGAPETALRWLSLAVPLLAGGLLIARLRFT